jgi:pimeloyl-ACP methyl ester carboxylesterase
MEGGHVLAHPTDLVETVSGPDNHMLGYRVVEFPSDDAVLRGRLYLPDRRPAAVVVMAHGFSATIPMVMDRYAECFQARGLAVLAFDHRGHGLSEGEPRGEINPWVQARGYVDAIDTAVSIPEVGTAPIALWSDSLSTRAALLVTALDQRARGLVCQVPALGEAGSTDDAGGARLAAMEAFLRTGVVRSASDRWKASAVVSPDQTSSPSALKPLTAFRWFIEYGGRYGSGWTNRVVFTTPGEAPPFDPFACAPRIRVPTLFAMSPDDEMPGADSQVTRAVFDRLAGPKELLEVEGGHFGIIEHPSGAFDRASQVQADFLARTFGGVA